MEDLITQNELAQLLKSYVIERIKEDAPTVVYGVSQANNYVRLDGSDSNVKSLTALPDAGQRVAMLLINGKAYCLGRLV